MVSVQQDLQFKHVIKDHGTMGTPLPMIARHQTQRPHVYRSHSSAQPWAFPRLQSRMPCHPCASLLITSTVCSSVDSLGASCPHHQPGRTVVVIQVVLQYTSGSWPEIRRQTREPKRFPTQGLLIGKESFGWRGRLWLRLRRRVACKAGGSGVNFSWVRVPVLRRVKGEEMD